jgi:hypothetical protein
MGVKMSLNVAVIGNGYWGRNSVRNFFKLGALDTVCALNPLAESSGDVPPSNWSCTPTAWSGESGNSQVCIGGPKAAEIDHKIAAKVMATR